MSTGGPASGRGPVSTGGPASGLPAWSALPEAQDDPSLVVLEGLAAGGDGLEALYSDLGQFVNRGNPIAKIYAVDQVEIRGVVIGVIRRY